jgi:hypothetical protein
VLSLVLPSEKSLLPNIRESLAVIERGDVFLKCECIAALICLCRMWLTEDIAKVYEMTLGGGSLGKRTRFPAFHEVR